MSRDEFKAKLTFGISKQAVIDAVGTPDVTNEVLGLLLLVIITILLIPLRASWRRSCLV